MDGVAQRNPAFVELQTPKPDITAYSRTLNEWRFCEAKRKGEPIHEEQLKGLAALHLLTGAPVAVVCVIEGTTIDSGYRSVRLKYKRQANLDWICRRFRR